MKVLVCGSTGCVGSAVVHALRARGHKVIEASRRPLRQRDHWPLDFAQAVAAPVWAGRLREAQVDAVVNCVGILMPAAGQSFERVHTQGPIELFRGAALAGVKRVLQVSALGVDDSPACLASGYLHSKLLADDLLASLPVDWAVLRPSLVYGPGSHSAALFATLAGLPVVSLPGWGAQQVQPLHVYELAEAIARAVEHPGSLRRVYALGGPQALGYREMLAQYRAAMGLGEPLWLPLPMGVMKAGALLAQALPQKVFSVDTLRLLERGNVPACNGLPALLGRTPTSMAQGLKVSPPTPWLDLRVQLSPAVSLVLRTLLAFMWICSAALGLWPPQLGLPLALVAFKLGLAAGVLLRPTPRLQALQLVALLAEVALDGGGALPWGMALPAVGLVLLLWLAQRPAAGPEASVARRPAAGSA